MNFSFVGSAPKTSPILFPVALNGKNIVKNGLKPVDGILMKIKKEKRFSGKSGEIIIEYSKSGNSPKRIIFFCVGEQNKLNGPKILSGVANALRLAKKEKGNEISMFFPEWLSDFAQTVSESLIMTNYNSASFKTGKDKKKIADHDIKKVYFLGSAGKLKANLEKGRLLASAVNTVRDEVNSPPNIMTPEFFEKEARSIAKTNGYGLRVLGKKELEKQGMNLILAVNRGSSKEARLIVLEYHPKDAENVKPIVFAGKGIIFDSGGYNLKPTGYIENMHLDMAGAASVLGLFRILKKMKVQVPVVGVMPITENLIGSNAVKPSEIITAYNGKTVEITNTDAEGRLILADAIAYAIKEYEPRYLVDTATLTGACMVALGDRYAGLFSNNRNLAELIKKSAKETDELVWSLPLHPEYRKALDGEISDLQNGEKGPRYAGASKAALFLKEFIGKTKWAHIDIAGPAYTENPKKYESKRGTGFGVRLFLRLLEKLTHEENRH